MSEKIMLLLYDMKKKDLARDLKDLLEEVGVGKIVMIPLAESRGLTLEEKEKYHFNSAQAALFLITPGSQKDGKAYPSPSVNVEIGLAKKQFEKKPESVFYLADRQCEIPAVDQKCRIDFDSEDMRTVLSALTVLVKEMKVAGLLLQQNSGEKQVQQKIDFASFFFQLSEQIKGVVFDISERPNGAISDSDIRKLLLERYSLLSRDSNFLLRDLQSFGLAVNQVSNKPFFTNFWFLCNRGWDVARTEANRRQEAIQKQGESLARLLQGLDQPQGFLGQRRGLLDQPPITGPEF